MRNLTKRTVWSTNLAAMMVVIFTTLFLSGCTDPDFGPGGFDCPTGNCPDGYKCCSGKCIKSNACPSTDKSIADMPPVKWDGPVPDKPVIKPDIKLDGPVPDKPVIKPDIKLDGPVPDKPKSPCVAPNGKVCSGHGTCKNGKCTCDYQYDPPLCDKCAMGFYDPQSTGTCILDPCSPSPCKNGGTCSNITGKAVCTCTNNWDPVKKCTDCKTGWDKSTNCTTCLPGYNPPSCTTSTPTIKISMNCGGKCQGNNSYNLLVTVENTKNFTASVSLRKGPGAKGMCDYGTITPTSGNVPSSPHTFKIIFTPGTVQTEPCGVAIGIKLNNGLPNYLGATKYIDVYK